MAYFFLSFVFFFLGILRNCWQPISSLPSIQSVCPSHSEETPVGMKAADANTDSVGFLTSVEHLPQVSQVLRVIE